MSAAYHTPTTTTAPGDGLCDNEGTKAAPRRCVNTVAPGGLADCKESTR